MGINSDEFKNAVGCFASGVTVVTGVDAEGAFHGMTVSAFSSVSLDPPLILVCVDKQTVCHGVFESTGRFVVNILKEEQQNLSQRFATPIADKFGGVEFSLSSAGVPILKGALVNLECVIHRSHEGGDHSIFVAEVLNLFLSEGKPLIHSNGGYRKLLDTMEANRRNP